MDYTKFRSLYKEAAGPARRSSRFLGSASLPPEMRAFEEHLKNQPVGQPIKVPPKASNPDNWYANVSRLVPLDQASSDYGLYVPVYADRYTPDTDLPVPNWASSKESDAIWFGRPQNPGRYNMPETGTTDELGPLTQGVGYAVLPLGAGQSDVAALDKLRSNRRVPDYDAYMKTTVTPAEGWKDEMFSWDPDSLTPDQQRYYWTMNLRRGIEQFGKDFDAAQASGKPYTYTVRRYQYPFADLKIPGVKQSDADASGSTGTNTRAYTKHDYIYNQLQKAPWLYNPIAFAARKTKVYADAKAEGKKLLDSTGMFDASVPGYSEALQRAYDEYTGATSDIDRLIALQRQLGLQAGARRSTDENIAKANAVALSAGSLTKGLASPVELGFGIDGQKSPTDSYFQYIMGVTPEEALNQYGQVYGQKAQGGLQLLNGGLKAAGSLYTGWRLMPWAIIPGQGFWPAVGNTALRTARSGARWHGVYELGKDMQTADPLLNDGKTTALTPVGQVLQETAATMPGFAAIPGLFPSVSKLFGQPAWQTLKNLAVGAAKTMAITPAAATARTATTVVHNNLDGKPNTPKDLVPQVLRGFVSKWFPTLDMTMNLGDLQQRDAEAFQAFRAKNPGLPETEALRAYTMGIFNKNLSTEMAKLPKDATAAQQRETRMHVLENMFRSSGTADLSMLADMDFMKSIGCEDASIDEIRGIAQQTLAGNIVWTKGQQGIGAMWDAKFNHTDVDNVISAMSENQDVRLLVNQYGTMEAMLMCRADYKPCTGQDSRLTEAFFSTMTDKDSAAQFAQQVLGKASPEAFGNFITHARAADTGDKKMSEGQVTMTNACLSMFGAKCQEDGDFARQALPMVQQSLAKGGALTQLDPRVEQHMANMLDSLDYDRIMSTIDNDKEAIQFCDYLASQKGQNSFMKMPPEQQKAIMGRIEAAAQTRCWEAFKRDPLGTAPLLASLWLKKMGLNGIADAVKNPAVFYGGLLLVVGGGIALLAGGDDDDDDDDDRAYKKRLKTDSEDAFYERIARGA